MMPTLTASEKISRNSFACLLVLLPRLECVLKLGQVGGLARAGHEAQEADGSRPAAGSPSVDQSPPRLQVCGLPERSSLAMAFPAEISSTAASTKLSLISSFAPKCQPLVLHSLQHFHNIPVRHADAMFERVRPVAEEGVLISPR